MKKTSKKNSKKGKTTPSAKLISLKHTATGKKQPGKLKYLAWDKVELETLNPLLQRRMIVGDEVMLARILLKKGCVVPMHSHVNEQLSYMLEGALKFWIDGKEIVVRAGEVLAIPSNMPHQAEALEDSVSLDVFHPPRADWLSGTDSYLRK